VSSGLNWVFEQEEQALILEDDCVPDLTFFRFCSELLERYRTDAGIGMIAGGTFKPDQPASGSSYSFSGYNFIWGWATWRRAWTRFDWSLSRWPELRTTRWLHDWLRNHPAAVYWSDRFDDTYAGKIDTWAYRWTYSLWTHSLLSIVPATNLVTNVGFGPDATHSPAADQRLSRARSPMRFPLRHPAVLDRDLDADRFYERNVYRIGWNYVIKRWAKRVVLRRKR
jgi:hypothetical protein